MPENPVVNFFDSFGNVEKTVFKQLFNLEEGESHPKKGHSVKASKPSAHPKPAGGGGAAHH